ncbi:histidine phosphatase family protein [Microgenomates group bacterium]|nr:histidine phosphatase family protein [Microgenomates group bacterium]
MEKINIYLIRHGESKANRAGIYQGQSYDVGLTLLGRRQAFFVATTLMGKNIQKIVASPLKRTFQTAMVIAKTINVPLITDQHLLEINHGNWEGKHPNDFTKLEKKILTQWQTEPHLTQMPDGEHFKDVMKRVGIFLLKLEKSKETTVIVAHDLILRVIIAMILNLDFSNVWNFRLDNCGLNVISFNPRRLIELNNRAHLGSSMSLLNRQAL